MQAAMLRDWGVTYLQGHLVGRAELQAPSQPALRKRAAG
jgi:EAL domain-containing protein (putative c-di-GMP-specific phosphodiesterase class I)